MKIFDIHSHNGFSRCVKSPWNIKDGLLKAKRLHSENPQIIGFGVTNHVHFNSPNQKFLFDLRKQIDNIMEKESEILILLGVELDIDGIEGEFTLDKSTLDILDYIIAGPHNQIHQSLAWNLSIDELEEYFHTLESCILKGLEKNPIDVWVHPFLQEIGSYGDLFWNFLEPIFNNALKILDKKRIAIEINGSWYKDDRIPLIENWNKYWSSIREFNEEVYKRLEYIYKEAASYNNIKFAFGSDAHSLNDLLSLSKSVKEFEKLKLSENRLFNPDIYKK